MSEVESEILTLEEVAAYLKAGKRTVYRLAQKGEIPGGAVARSLQGAPDRDAVAELAARTLWAGQLHR
jgi:excisionase family DNA binding protein